MGRSKCEDCIWFNCGLASKVVWCGKDNRSIRIDGCEDFELKEKAKEDDNEEI